MRDLKGKVDKKIQRDLAIQAGYYDGRFRARVVSDKKKVASKLACRRKIA